MNGDMRSTAFRIRARFGGLEAEVEEREQNVGTVGDVIPGPLPLQHRLMQDTARVNIRIQMVPVIRQAIETLRLMVGSLEVQNMLVLFAHIINGGVVGEVAFHLHGREILDTVDAFIGPR